VSQPVLLDLGKESLLTKILCPPACWRGPLAGVPRGRSIPLAKGGVNTSPAERGPRKIEDFVGFIIDRVSVFKGDKMFTICSVLVVCNYGIFESKL
jgi:hypothetical protein